MAQATRAITAEDLFRMPDDGYRYELVAGRLRKMTPAGGLHGVIAGRLHGALSVYVTRRHAGVVCTADTGFKLTSDPDTVRAPDVAFVSRAQIPATGFPSGYWNGPPDLAVEVLSPSDSRAEMGEKIQEYLQSGVKQIWFVDPSARQVVVHRPNVGPEILGEADTLCGGDLLQGFRYRLSLLFSADV